MPPSFPSIFIFSVESWLVSANAGVTCFRDSREPISALDIMTYVTPLMDDLDALFLCTISLKARAMRGSQCYILSKKQMFIKSNTMLRL